MEVSVIIPVFNAAPFVEKAVESALQIGEVKEILLIEDGSTDNSFEVCKRLELTHPKVKLFRHPKGENKGPSASRNIGILNSEFPYIAFLDADDFYLPNRFDADTKVFKKNPEADGVYNAMGFNYFSEKGEKDFERLGYKNLYSIEEFIKPDDLPFVLLGNTKLKGRFSIIGLTIRKSIAIKAGLFPEKLYLHEDSVFNIKLSIMGKLFPGEIKKPVVMYRAHDKNTITRPNDLFKTKAKAYRILLEWASKNKIRKEFFKLIEANFFVNQIQISSWLKALGCFLKGCLLNDYFFTKTKFFQPSATRIFGKNLFVDLFIRGKEKIQLSIFKIPLN